MIRFSARLRAWRWLAMRACFVVLLALLSSIASAQAPANASRIGFVDMQRLLDEAPQMATWRTRLEREFAKKREDISATEQRLTALRKDFETGRDLMTQEAANRLTREISTTERGLKRARDELVSLQATRRNEALDAISQKIGEASAQVARELGFSSVLIRDSAVYVDPALDLTEQVLRKLKADNS
jgi:outer membrane protein